MYKDVSELAYKLCQTPSISGDEQDVLGVVSKILSDLGFFIEKLFVDSQRFNIFAYSKKLVQYSAIFCTHLDTVAPFIAPQMDMKNGLLKGRGACDAKGIAACMITALLNQRRCGFDDLAMLLTVGEEEASDGAKAASKHLKNKTRFLIVGEPTDLKAANAQKGTLVFDLIAGGKEAHSSLPHLGDSAIHKLVNSICPMIRHPWPQDPIYGQTLINFGMINGGGNRNVLACEASAKAIARLSVPSSNVIGMIESMLEPGVLMRIKSLSEPFTYFQPDGFSSFVAGFGSDAPYLRKVGKQILLGPGSLSKAHQPDEHVAFSELRAGVLAYERIASQVRNMK